MIEPKFEFAPEEYWIECTFPEIKMYLFCLNIDGKIDWRLPTDNELFVYLEIEYPEHHWVFDDLEYNSEYWNTHTHAFTIIPVRDLKDD